MAGIGAVNGHMNNGSHTAAGHEINAQTAHQFVVAGGNPGPIHQGGDALAADLPDICHPAAVNFLPVGPLQAAADGVGGGAFRQGGVLDQRRAGVGTAFFVNGADLKNPLGQGAGFIEDHIARLGQGFQEIGAFHQDALGAGPPMPAKKLRGMLMTRAQGQLATKKVSAR